MAEPLFWDYVGPLSLGLFVAGFVVSVWGYRRGSALIVLICGLESAAVGWMAMWSIGSLFIMVALFQTAAALQLFFRKKGT